MKIIFLDIDGVLSSFGERGLCGLRLDMFCDVVKQTGAKVVLSSMWRVPHCREQRMRLQHELFKRGVELDDFTPVLGTTRGDEINTWLRQHRHTGAVERFVILDDDPSDEMGTLKPHLVKCDGYAGLTPEIATEVIKRLS